MCSDSALELPCVCTAAGMYCSCGCKLQSRLCKPLPADEVPRRARKEKRPGKCWDEVPTPPWSDASALKIMALGELP
jgi:hypothetical protein